MKRHLIPLAVTLLIVSTSHAYYQAEQGRWLNRDPVGELSRDKILALKTLTRSHSILYNELVRQSFRSMKFNDINLIYGFVENNPANFFDLFGLRNCEQNPGYSPTPNGCGPAKPKWLNKIVPEGFFPSLGGYSFTAACNTHDICYGTCCADKVACDNQFLIDMKSECNRWTDRLYGSGGIFGWIGEGRLKQADRRACYLDASLYHSAVAKGGQKAFSAAQKAACKCPDPNK